LPALGSGSKPGARPRLRIPAGLRNRPISRSPAIATRGVLASTTGLLYVVGGFLALTTAMLPSLGPATVAPMRWLAAMAILIGLVTLVRGDRFPGWSYHALVGLGTAIITALVLLAGGGTLSVSYAALYLFVAIDCFFFFGWQLASLHLLSFELAGAVAFIQVDIPLSQVLIPQGCAVVVAVLVGLLARAAAAGEQDPLTSLANRRGFERLLVDAMAVAERERTGLSIVLLDLDHFKRFNETNGHGEGDRLLSRCAAAWSRSLRSGQILARFGSDEFALILPSCPIERAGRIADNLRALISPELRCSAGVADWLDGDSASMLIGRADFAVYEAKSNGRDQTAVYGRPERAGADEIERAIRAGELEMYYQPIVALATGKEVGVEALVRWQHPERGLVMPADFIPQAERTGAILPLGAWALETACRYGAGRIRRSEPDWRIAINVSGRELRQPGYPAQVAAALAITGLPASALTLEVTESTFDADEPHVGPSLEEIRALGVRVALDDFGTGYSSLSRLDRLPVDVIKIDRSFVQAIPEQGADVPILQAIVALADALDLLVVAEGIETTRQAHVLRRLGCANAQGYLFGRPSPRLSPATLTPIGSDGLLVIRAPGDIRR
jgi:diguanylate cyclase (GGDEF)-like protein